jgi:hypothetical protein
MLDRDDATLNLILREHKALGPAACALCRRRFTRDGVDFAIEATGRFICPACAADRAPDLHYVKTLALRALTDDEAQDQADTAPIDGERGRRLFAAIIGRPPADGD